MQALHFVKRCESGQRHYYTSEDSKIAKRLKINEKLRNGALKRSKKVLKRLKTHEKSGET